MKHHGHDNPKRTVIVSDRRIFAMLDRGPLLKGQRKASYPTSYRYYDKKGKLRYVGIKQNLKKTG